MASITKQWNGRREVQFVGTDQKRRTIRLGKVDHKTAETFRARIEDMVSSRVTGEAISPHTAQWLKSLGDQLHDRLVRAGLCARRIVGGSQVVTLKSMLDAYVARRDDLKATTKTIYQHAQTQLQRYFGPDRVVGTITIAEAGDFRRSIRKQFAEATTAKIVIKARTFWRDAVDRKLVECNVFSKVYAGSQVNVANHRYLDRATIERVIAICPDPQWKLVIALSRFGGLRCPSEHFALNWADIDWQGGRMTVRASKTEHHADNGIRAVPLFPELRPYLEAVHAAREEGVGHVITRYRSASANLRTQFIRYIKKAGLTPWPRLFHNLRASCQTDLTERFPSHVVCDWIGNSEAVAKAHYLQTTDQHFATAAAMPATAKSVAQPDAKADAAKSGMASQPFAPSSADITKAGDILQAALQCAALRGENWAIQGSNL